MYGDQMCQEPLFSYSYGAVFVIASSMPESNTLIQNARPMKTIRDPKYNNHVLFLSFGKCIWLIEALTAFLVVEGTIIRCAAFMRKLPW